MASYLIAVIGLVAAPVDIIVVVHLITAVVSSELRSQRGEVPDGSRTALWAVVWVAVTAITVVAVGVVSTL